MHFVLIFSIRRKIYKLYSMLKIRCWLNRCSIRLRINHHVSRSIHYISRPCVTGRVFCALGECLLSFVVLRRQLLMTRVTYTAIPTVK
jgi:hypothetical protein